MAFRSTPAVPYKTDTCYCRSEVECCFRFAKCRRTAEPYRVTQARAVFQDGLPRKHMWPLCS